MADTVFRTASLPPEPVADSPRIPDPEPNNEDHHHDISLEEPVDISNAQQEVLAAIGIDDMIMNLPESAQDQLTEATQYILDILSSKGVTATKSTIEQTLGDLKTEMGLDPNAEAEVVLDRIGGVVKAWKGLSFINNPSEKRALFMKLARQPDSKSMNKMVFEEMQRREVWI